MLTFYEWFQKAHRCLNGSLSSNVPFQHRNVPRIRMFSIRTIQFMAQIKSDIVQCEHGLNYTVNIKVTALFKI